MRGSKSGIELKHLATEAGVAGSGRVRYAAAMHFFQAGMLDGKTLEIYRALAKDDDADPLAAAKALGGGEDIERLVRGRDSHEESA